MSALSRRAFIKAAFVAGSAFTLNAQLPITVAGKGLNAAAAKISPGPRPPLRFPAGMAKK